MGSSRFSEDLDFAGGHGFAREDASRIKMCIHDHISHRYGLEVSVKSPKQLMDDPRYGDVKVDKWQVAVVTAPERPDIPKQRIKLEVASVPAYSREPSRIKIHYPFLPDGYSDLLVITESQEEIMADKIVSLVNTQKYVRHRDIWDLQWLKQQGATPNLELIRHKINDYSVACYADKARRMIDQLPGIISGSAFRGEMIRFVPADTLARTLERPKFAEFLTHELIGLLGDVVEKLYGTGPSSPTSEFTL